MGTIVPRMLYDSASWSPVALPRGSGIIPEVLLLAWSHKSAKCFSIWKPQHHDVKVLKPHEERVGQGNLKQRVLSSHAPSPLPSSFAPSYFPPPSRVHLWKQPSLGVIAARHAAVQALALALRENPPPKRPLHLFHLSPFHLPPCPQGNTTQADKLMRQLALCSLIEEPFISLTSQANSQHRWVLDFISAMWFIFPLAHI